MFAAVKRALLLVIIACLSLTVNSASVSNKIKHVIVLMLENRSFDHMLGMLKKQNPELDGCLPGADGCSNPVDPSDPASATVTVDDTAVYEQTSPSHSISGTSDQIYGNPDTNTIPLMDGFINSYDDDNVDGKTIMKCFAPEHVPAISTLASEYAVYDGYFASVPGPTEPNRCYAMSATSHGMGNNDVNLMVRGMPQKTIFRQVEEMGLDYRIYMEQVPTALMFKDVRHKDARHRYRFLDGPNGLYANLESGDMPEYSWIEPSYFDVPEMDKHASDQHPAHDVSEGDALIKNLYEAIVASPIWNETAFVITYDEHGGFFDHVKPEENIPNPDGLAYKDEFDFTRQGVRVPFVVVSPWVKKGTVVHGTGAGQGQYEHSSIPATVIHKLFKSDVKPPLLQPDYLTERDAWAATFEDVFDTNVDADGTPTLRTDCLQTLPEIVRHRTLYANSSTYGADKMTDLQENLVKMMAGAVNDLTLMEKFEALSTWTEAQGGAYVYNKMKEYLE